MSRKKNASLRNDRDNFRRKKVNEGLGWANKTLEKLKAPEVRADENVQSSGDQAPE